MLTLTRREGEELLLEPDADIDPNMTVAELFEDGPISIFVEEFVSNKVKLSIDAPDGIEILRGELV